jgi:hypothetical protein
MADTSQTLHAADNPFNLTQLLDTGLSVYRTVSGSNDPIQPVVVQQPTQQVLTTPGASVDNPNKQVGETHLSDVIKKNIGWIIGGAVALGLAIFFGIRHGK